MEMKLIGDNLNHVKKQNKQMYVILSSILLHIDYKQQSQKWTEISEILFWRMSFPEDSFANLTPLSLSKQRSLWYRNQSIDLQSKSIDWFYMIGNSVMKELIIMIDVAALYENTGFTQLKKYFKSGLDKLRQHPSIFANLNNHKHTLRATMG